MTEFAELKKKEASCRTKTLADPHLKVLCALIENGLSIMQSGAKKRVKNNSDAIAFILVWNFHQLNAAYTSTLNGNYVAAISNIRSSFEGNMFIHKYSRDKEAGEKWMNNLDYESDRIHAIAKELTKKDAKQFSEYYTHYRNLSQLAHPYPKMRFLFSRQDGENTIVSLGGEYRKKWAGVLLSEILFSINSGLKEAKTTTALGATENQITEFETNFNLTTPSLFKYFAELKEE